MVYRAKDTRIGRTVVLKLLQADVEAHARRLLREAKAMAQLRHPHLVALHEVGEHDGKPYLVLPYVTGESLQDRLDESGPLQLEAALRLADQVAQALEAAHAAGLVHRDVKPANVLLDEHGRALLTDFGLVKKVGPGQSATLSLSVQGRFLGPPGYWPPERARGKHDAIGPPADVYAWGGLLYALLSGRPPRDAPNLQAALRSLDRPVEPLATFREDVPPWLERLVLACLVDDPQKRPTLAAARAALDTQAFRGPVSSRARLAWATGAAVFARALAAWSTIATFQRLPSRAELSQSAREPSEERGYWEPRAAGEGGEPTVVSQATCVLDALNAYLGRALPGDPRVFVVSESSLHVVGPRDVETHGLGGPARHLIQLSPSSVCYVLDRKLTVLELESSTRRSVRSLDDVHPLGLLPLTGGHQLAVATPRTVVLFELNYFTPQTELVLPKGASLAGLCESPAADAIYVWTRRGAVYRFALPVLRER